MKYMALAIIMTFSSNMLFAADSGSLDGKSFCRTVHSEGGFGQPAGDRNHCIQFSEGQVTDTGNTFFGNPPAISSYQVNGDTVVAAGSVYKISQDGQSLIAISGGTIKGTVFNLIADGRSLEELNNVGRSNRYNTVDNPDEIEITQ